MKFMNSLNFKAEIENLYEINNIILSQLNTNNKNTKDLELIIEEIFVNIVKYSNADCIKINYSYNAKTSIFNLEFIDNGIMFNPLEHEDYSKKEDLDSTPVGGLGIFFFKSLSDNISYEYKNNENHLFISKIIK